MRESGPGRWWGPREGSGVSEGEGTSRNGRGAHSPAGVRNLQSQPSGRAGAPATPVSPPPRPPTAAQAPTQPASALLVLALSRDRGPRGELSPAPRAARPPPLLLPRPGEPPIPAASPVWPCPSSGRTAVPQPWCASGFGRWGPREGAGVRGLTSHPAPAPTLRDPSGSIGWAEASRTRPHPPLCGKLIPTPLCLSFPLAKRMRLIATREPVVGSETV